MRHPQLLNAASLSPAPAAFAPLVRRCAAADPMAVRQLAARALPPLLAPEELAGALADLAASVAQALCPPPRGQQQQKEGDSDSGGGRPPLNAVHGWLLQLRLLLEGAAAGADVALRELAPALEAAAAQLR